MLVPCIHSRVCLMATQTSSTSASRMLVVQFGAQGATLDSVHLLPSLLGWIAVFIRVFPLFFWMIFYRIFTKSAKERAYAACMLCVCGCFAFGTINAEPPVHLYPFLRSLAMHLRQPCTLYARQSQTRTVSHRWLQLARLYQRLQVQLML